MSDMSKSQTAAAMYGLATNLGIPMADRLQCALQALEFYANLEEEYVQSEVVVVGGSPFVPEEAPQAWKDLILGFSIMSQHATGISPTHCEHDEMTVCGVDPHKFSREELAVLSKLGFFVSGHVGFNTDGSLDKDWDDEGTVWNCTSEYCEAHFKSYRFGSA